MTKECCFLGTSNSFKEVANRMLRRTAQKLKAGNKIVLLKNKIHKTKPSRSKEGERRSATNWAFKKIAALHQKFS